MTIQNTIGLSKRKKAHRRYIINIPAEKEKILLAFETEDHCKILLLLWKMKAKAKSNNNSKELHKSKKR